MSEHEDIAKTMHEAYERLAPEFGYTTRSESAGPWEMVPKNNRALMVAAVTEAVSPLLTRIAELEATIKRLGEQAQHDTNAWAKCIKARERLKCCGNCAYENQWFGSCDDDVDEELPDSGVVAPPDSCHFTPSRWTERGTK